MHLAFWKKRSPREILLRVLERAPLFGIVLAIGYQVVCIFGAMVFRMSILAGAGYHLLFWPTILLLRILPSALGLFTSTAIALCRDLPGKADIMERTPLFICNMAFAITLNLIITIALFALAGLVISLVIVVVKKRKGFRI